MQSVQVPGQLAEGTYAFFRAATVEYKYIHIHAFIYTYISGKKAYVLLVGWSPTGSLHAKRGMQDLTI